MKRMSVHRTRPARRRGFSLIELLIVLAILVLLASMVAPRLLGSRDKANIDAARTQINMLKSALELYSLDMSGYPTTEQGLEALVRPPAASSADGEEDFGDDSFSEDEDLAGLDDDDADEDADSSVASRWNGPYLKSDKVPRDPWGSAYRYEFPGRNNNVGEPDIWSIGPDRKDNTEDDIVSWTGKRRSGDGEADAEGFEVGGDSGDTEEVDLSRDGE